MGFSTDDIVNAYKVLDGERLSVSEAERLIQTQQFYCMDLYSLANKVRMKFSEGFDLCGIKNAKSGNCSEDCSFCAQSAHNSAKINEYSLIDEEAILVAAHKAKEDGAQGFCIVTSGTGYLKETPEFNRILNAAKRILDEVDNIEVHVSIGILSSKTIQMLKGAGVSVIHHNIESAPSYFPHICSTHDISKRIETVKRIRDNGVDVCCGGIIGLGESAEQRVEFAQTLSELKVEKIPLNIHQKIDGTRADAKGLSIQEILNTVAVFRLLNPHAVIKIAAGRESSLADYQGLVFNAGANGMLIGGYLTIRGRSVAMDKALARSLISE